MRRILLLVLAFVLGACARRGSDTQGSSSDAVLPPDIRKEVADLRSMCLVINDLENRLSYVTSPPGRLDPGFLAVPVEGRPTEHDLYPGIDSFAVSTPYVLIGCENSADVGAIVQQAFLDAQERNAPIKLWAKIDGYWKEKR